MSAGPTHLPLFTAGQLRVSTSMAGIMVNGTLTLVDPTNVSSEEFQTPTMSETDFGLVSIYRYDLAISVLLVAGYLSVFVVGLVGNSCVIWVVARTPRMRTVTNYLIVNLAFIDIVVLLVCVPSNLLSNLIHRK
ncbi:neuropeptide Y receptor-like [Tropilaelaps mercedesae]|uniref:Neuropeptide Y receptor-like n=1 Tax=Tropilaelaps mercedesae TaxID=418985 RepID=A0A1V9XIM3_9ACAR|nr:neuropeptide Y receptor-like [Tropilaelaps mercedesae]